VAVGVGVGEVLTFAVGDVAVIDAVTWQSRPVVVGG
jgi:hypothetical protein